MTSYYQYKKRLKKKRQQKALNFFIETGISARFCDTQALQTFYAALFLKFKT